MTRPEAAPLPSSTSHTNRPPTRARRRTTRFEQATWAQPPGRSPMCRRRRRHRRRQESHPRPHTRPHTRHRRLRRRRHFARRRGQRRPHSTSGGVAAAAMGALVAAMGAATGASAGAQRRVFRALTCARSSIGRSSARPRRRARRITRRLCRWTPRWPPLPCARAPAAAPRGPRRLHVGHVGRRRAAVARWAARRNGVCDGQPHGWRRRGREAGSRAGCPRGARIRTRATPYLSRR